MAKDIPLAGVFRIARLVGTASTVKLRKHHYRLGWESKVLEYNQRFGVGRYRDTLELTKIAAISLADEPGKRGIGRHIELIGTSLTPVTYKIKVDDKDFHNFLYWVLVSLAKHHKGSLKGIDKASSGLLKQSRKQKLKARQDLGAFSLDHDKFVNAVRLFEAARQAGADKPTGQFGKLAPAPNKVALFADGEQFDVGVYEGEGGTIVKTGKKLGEGGAGMVKLAQRLVTDLDQVKDKQAPMTEACVVKIAHASGLDPGARDTLNEGRVLAALGKHPNIIRLIDARISQFLVVLMLEQGSYDLATKANASKTKLTPAEIRSITRDMLCGLAHMHARRVYHLDFKPENVLLFAGSNGKPDLAKVIDFGKARGKTLHTRHEIYADTNWTQYGTVGYIPPEDFGDDPERGIHLAKRDAYAAGITIFRALIGPRYGWEERKPKKKMYGGEEKKTVVRRARFWRKKVHAPEAMSLLEADKLTDITGMAAAMIDPDRELRISVEDAYKVVAPAKTTLTKGRKRNALL